MVDTLIIERLREVESAGATEGHGIGPDGFEFLTLERNAVMVAPGRYPLKIGVMAHHGNAIRAEIVVPGRSGIFIHSGNRASESEGCPLVGSKSPAPGLLLGGLSDRVADKIAELVADVLKADGEAWIVIKPIPESV